MWRHLGSAASKNVIAKVSTSTVRSPFSLCKSAYLEPQDDHFDDTYLIRDLVSENKKNITTDQCSLPPSALARFLMSSKTDHVQKTSVWRHLELTAPNSAVAKVSIPTPLPTLQFCVPRATDDHQLRVFSSPGGCYFLTMFGQNQNLINALSTLHISHVFRGAFILIAYREKQHSAWRPIVHRCAVGSQQPTSKNAIAKVSLSSPPLNQSAARLCFYDYKNIHRTSVAD